MRLSRAHGVLCNARNVKKVPGRETNLTDSEWLADVAAHRMIRQSFRATPADP